MSPKFPPRKRILQLSRLAAGVAASAASAGAKLLIVGREEAAAALHAKTAARLLDSLSDMKGLPMKVGQLLSYMYGLVPPEHQATYRNVLSKLQVFAKPLPWEAMKLVLETELGSTVEATFAAFDTKPIAAASLGQVYSAKLRDGREVAVKVQFPHVARDVSADLAALRRTLKILVKAVPGIDIERLRADMMGRLSEETDYLREAENQRLFSSNCPLVPRGTEKVHWPFPDPASATNPLESQHADFRRVRDLIRDKLQALEPFFVQKR